MKSQLTLHVLKAGQISFNQRKKVQISTWGSILKPHQKRTF